MTIVLSPLRIHAPHLVVFPSVLVFHSGRWSDIEGFEFSPDELRRLEGGYFIQIGAAPTQDPGETFG